MLRRLIQVGFIGFLGFFELFTYSMHRNTLPYDSVSVSTTDGSSEVWIDVEFIL